MSTKKPKGNTVEHAVGAPVWYRPVRGLPTRYACVVATEWWTLGDGKTRVAHLDSVDPTYPKPRVTAAVLWAVEPREGGAA